MHRRRGSTSARGGSRALAAVLTAALLLGGCARIEAVEGWTPPAWPETSGVQLVVNAASDAESGSAGNGESGSSGAGDDAASGSGAGSDAPAPAPDLNELGFIENRIRNDALALNLRSVELPGIHAFNARVAEVVTATIASVGGTFVPEVYPVAAGLSDRGCVAGSTTWPAAEVLSDPRTGPAGGSGLALTCEVTAATGSVVGVTMRTVLGTAAEVSSDTRLTLYADLATDSVFDGGELWSADAAPALWTAAVKQVRREAGGLSAAPLAAPAEAQVALAAQALASARFESDGSAVLTLPAGLASPELAGLGVEATPEPTVLRVAAETLAGWQGEVAQALQQQAGQPFVGLAPWDARQPVNCAQQACVAVTYDDGPTQYTGALLDALQAERAPTTLFMLGSAAAGNPELVQRAASEGHEIASHTMSHPDLTTLKPAQVRSEVEGAAKILSDLTGIPVTMYRPPYGALNAAVLAAEPMPAILWSIDTNDWRKPGTEALVERSVGAAVPGDIILFHDTHAESVDAAGVVMRGLKDRGFTPVTVTQLFGGAVPGGKVTKR